MLPPARPLPCVALEVGLLHLPGVGHLVGALPGLHSRFPRTMARSPFCRIPCRFLLLLLLLLQPAIVGPALPPIPLHLLSCPSWLLVLGRLAAVSVVLAVPCH